MSDDVKRLRDLCFNRISQDVIDAALTQAWFEGSIAMRKAHMVQGESLPANPYRSNQPTARPASPPPAAEMGGEG